jgi:quercetin dioxygenase-like cupin family protein
LKTIVQKIHLELNHSFSCKHYETPFFETNWHKHDEHELILITAGSGNALIGDYIGEYVVGDIFYC